jgi:flagellar motor switch protein FliN/FliY
LASDISGIIKEDIASTLEGLLSVDVSMGKISSTTKQDIESTQCIDVEVDFEFAKQDTTTKWKFYIPTNVATRFEFLMLGGIGDLKEIIDDEVSDAISEIISNICGTITTSINAQEFDDLGSAKFTVSKSEIIQGESLSSLDNTFKFKFDLGDTKDLAIFIEFETDFISHISIIANGNDEVITQTQNKNAKDDLDDDLKNNPVLSLLGKESIENLKLLFDIKFRLSVRLGTKTLLLKDITTWDTGTIIELEQMVNEPLDILANGVRIGVGEAVIIDGKFGIKIKHIGHERLN